ncbi:LysR family transcriptional regulator [Enterobacter cancerogenus]|uniref:LysR family transcriptional regulator n=1 Tax=Enterobacter cancerogenus TaxID=69218 RepID=UPI0030766254
MKGIDIKLLRAFVTLAEQGSYHRASRLLYLTQPALSKQIKMFEALIGGPLFTRGRHGATLTEYGRQLFLKANELLKIHTDFLNYAQKLFQESHEKLILGFGISTFHTVPVWINTFRNKFSKCEVNISNLPSGVQRKMLLEGTLDIGFLRMPAASELASKVLYKENLILAMPSLETKGIINIRDVLSHYPLLQLSPTVGPCLAEQTALFLIANQLNADPVSVTDDMPTLLALIAGGNGVAFLPESVRHFLPAGVRLITPDLESLFWEICVAWNPKINNPYRDEFLRIIEAHTGKDLM